MASPLSQATTTSAPRWKLALALATVYVVWGSTFLAIRVAVAFIPPFLLAALRFLNAGIILFAIGRPPSDERLTFGHWRSAAIIGTLLLVAGNGVVVWAEQRIPSGIAALVISTVPLWMVCLPAFASRQHRPSGRIVAGLILGLFGVGILVPWPSGSIGNGDTVSYLGLLVAALSWSLGTLYSKNASLPKSSSLSAGMEMMAGGVLLLAISGARGEWESFAPRTVPIHAWMSLLYLIVFGSVIAFSAYRWLLPRITTAQLSTYAYVNPLVAVLLGWVLLGERVTGQMLIGAVLILGSVGLISYASADV